MAILEWNKNLTAEAFDKSAKDNNECVILVATNAYGMDIDNLDIKLVIQWDPLLLFDSMIQQMERAGKKGEASTFILLTPKWTKIEDPDKIKKRMNSTSSILANAQLLDSNWPKALPKNNLLSKMLNIKEEKLNDLESVARSEYDLELNKEVDLFSGILASDANQNWRQ